MCAGRQHPNRRSVYFTVSHLQSPINQATLNTQSEIWYQRDQLVKAYPSSPNSTGTPVSITLILQKLWSEFQNDFHLTLRTAHPYKNLSKNRERVSVCLGQFFQCENACFLRIFYFQAQDACQMCKLGAGMGVR